MAMGSVVTPVSWDMDVVFAVVVAVACGRAGWCASDHVKDAVEAEEVSMVEMNHDAGVGHSTMPSREGEPYDTCLSSRQPSWSHVFIKVGDSRSETH